MAVQFRSTWREKGALLRNGLQGVVTIIAFTESGRMRRFRAPKRLLLVGVVLLTLLVAGASLSIVQMFRGQVDLARMAYLERENRSLTQLLEGQAEQLSRLKLEVAHLKEFEQSLRAVSGLDSQGAPMVGTGHGRGVRQELPKKR
jgi:hypothetical protein